MKKMKQIIINTENELIEVSIREKQNEILIKDIEVKGNKKGLDKWL